MYSEFNIPELEEKLLRARCRLMTREPWYGAIAMMMDWIPSDMPFTECEDAKTMGVRIVNGGVVQCLWYPGFVQNNTIRELYGVIQHEIEHIVRCHTIRIGPGREHERWNLSCDMIVNGKKSKPICTYHDPSTNEHVLPASGNGVYLPEDWELNQTTEAIYEKIGGVTQRCPKCGGKLQGGKPGSSSGSGGTGQKAQKGKGKGQTGQGKGQGNQGSSNQGSGQSSDNGSGTPSTGTGDHHCSNCGGPCDKNGRASNHGQGRYEYGEYSGRITDNHDIWQQTDSSEDEVRQIVKDMTDQATEKCQGTAPGHLTSVLKELSKPIVRWRELLRIYLGTHVGNRRMTHSRRNRRNDAFGLPGISHHAAGRVAVIVDTSGSISEMELMQFFTEIETISSRALVYVLQWDYNFQSYEKYKRRDWKKFKIKGRGGTDMAGPVLWLTENRLVPDCTVMLTDGYCNWSKPQPWYPEHGMITVITSGKDIVKPPDWGHTIFLRGMNRK